MSDSLHALSEVEIERMLELARLGARAAAEAFSQLIGRRVLARPPIAYGPERFRHRGEWTSGIFCELRGAQSGLLAMLLPPATRDEVVRLLCGGDAPPREIAASALCEVGNILASKTASAMADALGARIVPALPELVSDRAEAVLQARTRPRGRPPRSLYVASELIDREVGLRALHAWLPDLPKSDAAAR